MHTHTVVAFVEMRGADRGNATRPLDAVYADVEAGVSSDVGGFFLAIGGCAGALLSGHETLARLAFYGGILIAFADCLITLVLGNRE